MYLLFQWLIYYFWQVIFMALDFRIKNVVCTYTLEHESIDNLFHSISDCLSVIMDKEENTAKQFQELVFCIVTIQTVICQHMLKEEKQVPILFFIRWCCSVEVAMSLVLNFCSIGYIVNQSCFPLIAWWSRINPTLINTTLGMNVPIYFV